MNTTLVYYTTLLAVLSLLIVLCIPMVVRYTARFQPGTLIFLVLTFITISIAVGPFTSNYGDPDSQNWKFEARAQMLNKGIRSEEMRHPFGYIFLLSMAGRTVGNDPGLVHYSAMGLNAAFLIGAVVLVYLISLLFFENAYAAIASGSFFALMSRNWYECLSCEHRIISSFFVLLLILSIVALSKKNRPVIAAIFLLSAIWAVEVRIDNILYFPVVLVFILLYLKRFSRRYLLFAAFVFIAGGCVIASIPFVFQTGSGFFSLSFFLRDLPVLKNLLFENAIIPAVCIVGLILGFRNHAGISAFLIFWFMCTIVFWASAATVTMHREIVYLYGSMSLMFGLAVMLFLDYFSNDKKLQKIVMATLAAFGVYFFVNQILHRPDNLAGFGIRQEYDREIREHLEELPPGYAVLLRSEYTYVAAPGSVNPMPIFRKQSVEELAAGLKTMNLNGTICFSEISSEYDCEFFEVWGKGEESEYYFYDEDVERLNFERLGLEGRRTERRGKYLKAVTLHL